jgi:hypothetical protein
MSPSESRIDELIVKANELIQEVGALNRDSGKQIMDLAYASKANRRMIWALIASFALDVILTVLIGFGFQQVSDNNNEIQRVADRVSAQQTLQRDAALCPLYRVFLDAEKRPPPNLTEQQKRERAEGYKVLHKSYDALECASILPR